MATKHDGRTQRGQAYGVWEPEGEPAGTILAIHGITSSHLAWAPLARALPQWRIVAPDLRGRGASRAMSESPGMARHADDMAALCDELSLRKVLPVGHSMGGFVTVVLASRHPDLMDRVILVDGGMPLEVPAGIDPRVAVESTLGPAAQRLCMTFPSREAYRAFWQEHPAFAHDWSDDVAAYVDYDLVDDGEGLHPATSYDAMAGDSLDLVAADDNALVEGLRTMTKPALLLRAERGMADQPEGLYDAAYLERWEARCPWLSVRTVKGVNHYTITLSERGAQAIADAVGAGDGAAGGDPAGER